MLCACIASPVIAQSDDYTPPAEEMVEAMAIIEVMLPAQTREQDMLDTAMTMANQYAASAMSGPIFEEPGIRAIMDQFLADMPDMMRPMIAKHMPSMMKSTAIAYTREFTLEELRDIREFASTPSGSRYFRNAQKLLSDPAIAQSNQEFFSELNTVQEVEVKKLQARVVEYLQNNPDAIERLEAAGVGK